MPQVRIWANPDSGELEDLDDELVSNHLRGSRRKEPSITKLPQLHIKEIVEKAWNACQSVNDIVHYVSENFRVYAERGRTNDLRMPRCLTAEITNKTFGLLSNDDFCPHNGVTNWKGFDKDRPIGYLGYDVKVKFTVTDPMMFDVEKAFEGTRLHIRGSLKNVKTLPGHNDEFWLDMTFRIFLDDWPALAEATALERLMGTNSLVEAYYSGRR